ncbi:hypothetical protein NUW54_g3704 [Trametes sanguinea]|uniref:Uncharacterized protein n=1 Tax=Trametes sanguinea TaxID=158606 RepID=A0ACC1Q252_9APHY|nr:hypothetical protein NUW54_g3704 [Trametes sanguinea]
MSMWEPCARTGRTAASVDRRLLDRSATGAERLSDGTNATDGRAMMGVLVAGLPLSTAFPLPSVASLRSCCHRAAQSPRVFPRSVPVRPHPRTHRYGYGGRYGDAGRGRSALASESEDPTGADRDPDALPPSSPSTLPVSVSSDCNVWTDTDGDPECSSGSGQESGVPFPLAGDRADDAEEDWGAEDEEAAAENKRYMIELPLQTPFPANPVLRRRVRRASEKIERQVSRGWAR